MRTVTGSVLIALLILLAPRLAHAQDTTPPDGTRITSVQVSGIELSQLSQALQDDIRKLAGTPLDRQLLRSLASRIESERPRMVAAVRVTADATGAARVALVVARLSDADQQSNVNTKYVVSDAQIKGVPDRDISSELRTELQALIGKPLDAEQAERLEVRLRSMFPEYEVTRVSSRGDETGHIKVQFVLRYAEWARWLRFEQTKSNLTYHADQKWGARLDVAIGSRDVRVTPLFAIDSTDDVIEQSRGYGVRFEARKLGTERLGVSLEGTWFKQKWQDSTLAAVALDPSIPVLYEKRSAFTPMLSFAVTRHLTISGGVSIAELEPLQSVVPLPASSSMANVAIGSLAYHHRSKPDSGAKSIFDATFSVRSAKSSLESDLIYKRSFGQASYSYESGRQHVFISGMAGSIDGNAPMFERFSLGDTRTLRGWNKYDISPAGGTEVAYGSIEYRYGVVAVFLDSGSVWDKNATRQWRASSGVGIHSGPFFMTLGVPLNTGDLRAVFMIGFRAGGNLVIVK